MGNGQPGLSDYFTPIKQDVNVECARSFGMVSYSVVFPFDIETGGQQIDWRKVGSCLNNRIQKPWLIENFSRLSRINGSAAKNVDTMFGQGANSSAEMLFAVTEVGSERQINNHTLIMKRSIS